MPRICPCRDVVVRTKSDVIGELVSNNLRLPLTMLGFVALIVARWLGWSAPNLAEAEALKLWDIVEIGLGGYVIGRSAEKVLPGIIESTKK